MATANNWAQDVITCDLCDKPTQQFCNSCQVSLCKECVSKHTHEFKRVSHEIVSFERKTQLAFPECQDHGGQRCEVHCKKCKRPVCVKCIVSGPHRGHDVEELIETFKNIKQKVIKETHILKTDLLPKYQKEDAEIKSTTSKTKTKFDDFGKDNKKLRHLWHLEVDAIFDKIDFVSISLRNKNMISLHAYQNKIRARISEMIKRIEENEKTLKSSKLSKVNSYKCKLKWFEKFPEIAPLKMPSLNTTIENGKELSLEIGDFRAILTQKSMPSLLAAVSRLTTKQEEPSYAVRVIATIATKYRPLLGIACVGETDVWIHGENKTITRIDILGSAKETVTSKSQYGPSDIAVTGQGEMIYSDDDSFGRNVKIIKQGKSETLVSTPHGWRARGLCCSKSGAILVHMRETWHLLLNKIACYHGDKVTQEFEEESPAQRKHRIFKEGFGTLYMSENNNGDICVADTNARIIVGINSKGKVLFRYDGTPARRQLPFNPRHIVTDAFGQIIVTDINNDCLHILGQNGQFLKCVEDCGLERPYGLSIDNMGRLWVGSCKSGIISVIEYLSHT